jgi:hypothetical protein
MNPPDLPPVGIDEVVAAQMMVIQQMTNIVTENAKSEDKNARKYVRTGWRYVKK